MDNSVDEHPIETQIATERKERQRQEAACIEAIKEVLAAEPTIKIGTQAEWARHTRSRVWLVASPPILKYSSGGVFKGWYRPDQKRGMPSLRSPVERFLEAAYKERETSLRRFINPHDRAVILGRKSGRARITDSTASQIPALISQLAAMGIPKHQCAKKAARFLDCSIAYVHRVLREKKTIAIQKRDKNDDINNKKMSPEQN